MAEEEEVVVEKKSGGGAGGLIPLITLVLVVVSVGLAAFSLVTVMGLKKNLMTTEEEELVEDVEPGQISVLEIETFAFTENFVFRYKGIEDPEVTDTVVVDMSVGVHSNEDTAEEAAELMALMSSKEAIIRSGLETLMTTVAFEDFKSEEGQTVIKGDILTYLQERLVTDLIIDVYFTNTITQSSK